MTSSPSGARVVAPRARPARARAARRSRRRRGCTTSRARRGATRRPSTAPTSPRASAPHPGGPAQRGRELAVRAALLVGAVRRRRMVAAGEQAAHLAGQRLGAAPAADEARRRREGRELPRPPARELDAARRRAPSRPARGAAARRRRSPRRCPPSANDTAAEPSDRRSTSSASPRPSLTTSTRPPSRSRSARAWTRHGASPAARASRGVQTPPPTRQIPCFTALATCAAIGGTDPTAAAPATTAHTTARSATYSAEA